MKKILALIICVVMTMTMFTGCLIQKNAETVLTVGEAKMSEDEFAYYLYAAKMEYLQQHGMLNADEQTVKNFLNTKSGNGDKTHLDIIKENAVNQAYESLVQYNKALEKNLGMTEADEKEFQNQLELIYTQNGGKQTMKQQFDDMGVTAAGFEEFNKRYMVIEKLYNSLEESGELKVSDEEISKYIGDNYIGKDYIKAKHILFSTIDSETQLPLAEEEIASKKKLAQDTLSKIKAGEDYDALMNELSEDPGLESSPTGYIFTRGEMVAPFEEAAYALADNQVSEIVESDFGYHIIKRVPITAQTLGEQEKANIVGELQAQKSEKLTAEWKKNVKLEKKDKLVNKLAEKLVK